MADVTLAATTAAGVLDEEVEAVTMTTVACGDALLFEQPVTVAATD